MNKIEAGRQRSKRHGNYLLPPASVLLCLLIPCYLIAAASVTPMSAGLWIVRIPAADIALYFSAAVPAPPLIIALAWPMRRPGGAVWPAIKPTTGFFTLALM